MLVKNDSTGIQDKSLYTFIQKAIGCMGEFTTNQAEQVTTIEINSRMVLKDDEYVPEYPVFSFEGIGILKNLKTLLVELNVTEDISPISDLQKLEKLCLNIAVNSIEPLKKMDNLKTLEIYGSDIKDLSPLLGLKNLESLTLSACNIGNAYTLMNLRELKLLKLENSHIYDSTSFEGVFGDEGLRNISTENIDL